MYRNRKPQPNLRRRHLIITDRTLLVRHWASAAARLAGQGPGIVNTLTGATTGLVPPRLTKDVTIKRAGYSRAQRPRTSQPSTPRVTAHFGGPLDASAIAILAQAFPKGFRQPSAKAKNWSSESLVQKRMIAEGQMEQPTFEHSARWHKRQAITVKQPGHDDIRVTYREAVIRTQNSANIDPKYLSAHARRRLTAQSEPLPEAA